MPSRNVAVLFGTVATIALLAGCASQPQVSSQQESSRYLSRARGNYRPPGPASDPWGPYIHEAAAKYDVPEKWIREVMRQESGGHLFNHGGDLITSGAGAMGLMQVMPATYDDLRGRYSELGEDPYDPHNNILAGTAYIREMYDIFGAPGFLAAYNAGPGRLDDYLTRSRALPTETRRYVAAIGPRIAGYEPRRASPGAQYAMNAVPLDIPAGARYPQAPVQLADAAPVEVAQAPVVVAEARPTSRYITLSRPAAEPAEPIRLNPPVAFAQAEPPRPYITLQPPVAREAEPVRFAEPARQPHPYAVAEEDETIRSALGAARRAEIARPTAIPLPPDPPPTRYAWRSAPHTGHGPIEVAEFPEPPRPPSQRAAAAAELVALGPHPHAFSFVGTANAVPIRPAVVSSRSGGWAVQVGAFANQNLARSATEAARDHARDVLKQAHPIVASVRHTGGTLYRARFGGLSHEAATEACARLSRARTSCMVVSPEAQR